MMSPTAPKAPSVRELLRRPIDPAQPVPYVSVYQVAAYMCRSTMWVYQQIHKGKLLVSRWCDGAGEMRIKWSDFMAFLSAGEQYAEHQESDIA